MNRYLKILLAIIAISFAILGYIYNEKTKLALTQKIEVISPYVKNKSIFAYFLKDKPKPKKIIYGYLPYWSLNKIKFLQLDKLTDIAYFGLYINEDGSFKTKLDDGTAEPGYQHWRKDEDLKNFITYANKMGVHVALTVISHDDVISDKFLACETCKKTLLNNLIQELDYHKIKDVNLNFEYVEFQDKEVALKYTALADYINKELDKKYGNSFVTVATFADSFVKPRVTDVESLGKVTDGLFIMAYDFHQPQSDNAGPVAPVNGAGTKSAYDITTMLTDYMRVVPPSKIILGVPYYGYNWVVEDDKEKSKRIPGTDQIGYSESQAYSDILDTIAEQKPEIKWDEVAKVPHFEYKSPETGSMRQVYYENEKSLKVKYELINSLKLAGVGIWALGYDGGYQELWNLLGDEFLK